MFRNLNTSKYALVCRPCAGEMELDANTPWKLLAL